MQVAFGGGAMNCATPSHFTFGNGCALKVSLFVVMRFIASTVGGIMQVAFGGGAMNCATPSHFTFGNGCALKVSLFVVMRFIASTVGAMNCATTNRSTFENRHPFERVPVCSDAIHRIVVEALLQKLSKL